MSLLGKLFGRGGDKNILPPLQHDHLGELRWDPDSTGWIGSAQTPTGPVELYVGLGDVDCYPDPAALKLIADLLPFLGVCDEAARPMLQERFEKMRLGKGPGQFRLTGAQIFAKYVAEGIVELVFQTIPDDRAIWRVGFKGTVAQYLGRDD